MTLAALTSPNPLVLVVDDDLVVRLLAREALESDGFRVMEAEDGAAAVAIVAAMRPAIVLLDVMMPVMDGFVACAALRRTHAGEDIPILMMTGLDDVESIRQAYEAGATDFVVKPINWLILGHRVRYMLRASAALQGIKASETRLANAQRIAQLGNWNWDISQDHWDGSAEYYRILGVPPEQFAGTHQAFLACIDPKDSAVVAAAHAAALKTGKPCHLSYCIPQSDGTHRSVDERAEVILDETGQAIIMTGTVQDITARQQAEEKIRYLAYYDTLTSLPNRQSFLKEVEQALALAAQQERLVAILFLDLDNFKRINDTLGHSAGDLLLQAVASRLLRHVRTIDRVARYELKDMPGNIAHLGGDEFTILLTEIQRLEDVATVAQRIQEILTQPLSIADHDVVTTASMGIAVFPHDGKNVDHLLKNADTAMYSAKAAGKGTYKFYAQSMNARALQRLSLENRLRKALEQEELILYYQPQVELKAGTLVGMEVLLRWHNPEIGLTSPAEFIPLAEETGLILAIGEWVLQTACAQNKAWQAAGFTPLRIAVNLSSRQFQQPMLAVSIGRILAATRLDPRYLELELTESMIMQHTQETLATLHTFKEMGLSLSVDDFGTGYSSLSYLKRFPLDTLKIDRSFVKDIAVNADDAAITTAIIAMAHNLNLKVIAEGVETEQQLAFLRQHHCDKAQGYLLGKPLPAEEITRLLEQSRGIIITDLSEYSSNC